MSVFSPKDFRLTIAPAVKVTSGNGTETLVPLPGGSPLTSWTGIDFDHGGDADHLIGHTMKSIGVIIKAAKGKMTIDFSNGIESQATRRSIGGIGSPCLVTIVGARSGMIPVLYVFSSTWKNGGAGKIGDKGIEDKVEILYTECLENGLSVYNEAA